MSSPKRRKVLNRTGLALLSVLALVGDRTVAWGHGTIGGGGDRVHTCMRALPPRLLRVVTPAEVCSSFEQGLDFPSGGTLIGVELGPDPLVPLVVPFTVTAGAMSPPIVVACPAPPAPAAGTLLGPATGPAWLYRVIGVSFTHTDDLWLALSQPTSDTTWQVAFIAATGGNKNVVIQAVCVRQFQQA